MKEEIQVYHMNPNHDKKIGTSHPEKYAASHSIKPGNATRQLLFGLMALPESYLSTWANINPGALIHHKFLLSGHYTQLSTSARGYSNKKPSINDVLPGAGGGELPKAWKVLIGCVNAWQGGVKKPQKFAWRHLWMVPKVVARQQLIIGLSAKTKAKADVWLQGFRVK